MVHFSDHTVEQTAGPPVCRVGGGFHGDGRYHHLLHSCCWMQKWELSALGLLLRDQVAAGFCFPPLYLDQKRSGPGTLTRSEWQGHLTWETSSFSWKD